MGGATPIIFYDTPPSRIGLVVPIVKRTELKVIGVFIVSQMTVM